MRVAITGASGNVGTAVLRRLAQESTVESVTGIVRRPPRTDAAPYGGVNWVAADIGVSASEPLLRRAFTGADVVVHLAWLIQPSHRMALVERVNVEGSRRVVECAVAAGVPHLVYASSVGAYSPKPDDERIDEHWPVDGVPTSYYSRHKAQVEHLLDEVERDYGLGVTRMRPGLIFQRDAGAQIARYFVGPFVPRALLTPGRIPVLPWPRGLRIQGVHADDVADAYVRAILRRPGGAFNVVAEPVIDGEHLAAALHARAAELPRELVSIGARASWHARLQPVSPGWLHLAFNVPLLDAGRARAELGWQPAHSSTEAVLEVLRGIAAGDGTASPAMRPGTALPERVRADGLPGTRRLQ